MAVSLLHTLHLPNDQIQEFLVASYFLVLALNDAEQPLLHLTVPLNFFFWGRVAPALSLLGQSL